MGDPKRILVVDHDADIVDLLVGAFEDRGYQVSASTGGSSMRELLAREPIDAVIMDESMPGEASVSLMLHVKELKLPLVMISGSDAAMAFAADHGLQLLHKPFRLRELYEALDEAFASGEFGRRDA